jgi:hypothetical protein
MSSGGVTRSFGDLRTLALTARVTFCLRNRRSLVRIQSGALFKRGRPGSLLLNLSTGRETVQIVVFCVWLVQAEWDYRSKKPSGDDPVSHRFDPDVPLAVRQRNCLRDRRDAAANVAQATFAAAS